jgi:LPS-assembly lipoprotein
MKKSIIPFICCLFLCACGFHLRGMIDIPTWLESISIVAQDDNTVLAELIKTQLEGYKIKITDDLSQAKYWLVIDSSTLQQKIISIGASTNPRQYQLIMTTVFLMKTREGQLIKPAQKVVATRQLTVNNDRILGSNEEESLLVNEMRQDTAVQIINRLSKK